MKKASILIWTILLAGTTSALGQQLTFTFDAAGNQTQRKWICTTCLLLSEQADIKIQEGPMDTLKKQRVRKSRKDRKSTKNLNHETADQDHRMSVGPPDRRT